MFAWRAVYKLRCKESDETRTVEYFVAAPTAGDVSETIRAEMNFDNTAVDEVEIKRMTEKKVIIARHLEGPVQ